MDINRLITPLRRSADTVAPPKISRFIIRYITRIPGSEKLKPDGTGFRPANFAFKLTGLGLAMTARSFASVNAPGRFVAVATSSRWPSWLSMPPRAALR